MNILRCFNIKKMVSSLLAVIILFSSVNYSEVIAYAYENNEDKKIYDEGREELFRTNLEGLYQATEESKEWTINENGLTSVSNGDSFIFSNTSSKNFVYSAHIKFNEAKGAASLVIRTDKNTDNKNSYVVNINGESGEARLFKFENNNSFNIATSKKIQVKSEYDLKVIAIDKHILFYIDGELIASTADYISSKEDLGQNDVIMEGYLGLLSWNTNVTYQDVFYTDLNEENTPVLKDLQISSTTGNLESDISFKANQYQYIIYASNKSESIRINPIVNNNGTKAKIINSKGEEVIGELPLEVGSNIYSVISENIKGASVVYNLVIQRRSSDEIYYNEKYRGQYHYSVKEGWGNDPNGMVYYNGEYHLFYQFYNDTNWGPMHWGHAISKDMITWEDQPITFYPDEYGTMFSGCAVVDKDNTSRLFKNDDGTLSETGGLVAIITANGNGQRLIAAYSKDGRAWEKTEDVLVDWTEDPLNNKDFRDPKVFRYQDKWFMVIAGGPLRIYSSDNLLDWEVESTYEDLHTECPDLYRLPLTINGDTEYKWVLSRGGRYYKIGDFREVDGKWQFIADTEYEGNGTENDGVMNFGKDSYAAMTYYMDSFDGENIPDVIEINWMNNWEYCNLVDDASENEIFNGTYNLQLKVGLTRDENGKIVLTQKPIENYNTLRLEEDKIELKDVEINQDENILKDFAGDSYNIVANFKPEEGTTEAGFKVRTGNKEETVIKYNFDTKKISIDRSKSGSSPSISFLEVMEESVSENLDGSIDLNIYVDRASVEVFSKNYTVAGSAQIFPSETSHGLEVFSKGDKSIANIEIYQMDTIWKDKVQATEKILLSKSNIDVYKGDIYELIYKIKSLDNQAVNIEMTNNEVAEATIEEGKIFIRALGKGTATMKISSVVNPNIYSLCEISVKENNFNTNLSGWEAVNGNWGINDKYYEARDSGNAFTFASNRAESDKYTYKADVIFNNGLANIIFGAQTTNVWDGAYALQLTDNKVRFFDFKGDKTFAEAKLPEGYNDMKHVEIKVDGNHIIAYINNEKYIDEIVEEKYSNGLFGLGIYNSYCQFSNVTVEGDFLKDIIVSKVSKFKTEEVTNNKVILTWEEPKNIVELVGYEIYKDDKFIGEVEKDTIRFIVEGLKENTIYRFKVISKYSNGQKSKPVSINARTKKK